MRQRSWLLVFRGEIEDAEGEIRVNEERRTDSAERSFDGACTDPLAAWVAS